MTLDYVYLFIWNDIIFFFSIHFFYFISFLHTWNFCWEFQD